MSNLVIVNVGERALLVDNVESGGSLNGCDVLLFQSIHAPDPDDVAADYTAIECDFTGYVRGTPTWGVPATNPVTGRAESLSSPMIFTPSSGPEQTVCGYAILDSAGVLIGAQLFEAEDRILIGAGGADDFVFQVKFTGRTEFDA